MENTLEKAPIQNKAPEVENLRALQVPKYFWEFAKPLPMEERGQFLSALCQYAFEGTEPELSGAPKGFFEVAREKIDAQLFQFRKLLQIRREAGKLGGQIAKELREKARRVDAEEVSKPQEEPVKPKAETSPSPIAETAETAEAEPKKKTQKRSPEYWRAYRAKHPERKEAERLRSQRRREEARKAQ